MKNITLASFLVTLFTLSAQAQLRDSRSGAMAGLKDARKQMEMNTELTILEKLEAARLADEKNRRQKFESLNFSVVNDGTNNSASSQNSF